MGIANHLMCSGVKSDQSLSDESQDIGLGQKLKSHAAT